jgi:hypothetical protein
MQFLLPKDVTVIDQLITRSIKRIRFKQTKTIYIYRFFFIQYQLAIHLYL